MSVLSKLFGGQQTAVPAVNPNAPAQPGNIPETNNMPANPSNPSSPAEVIPTTPVLEGLDKFTDMWNVKPEDIPKPPASAFEGVTPATIRKVAGNTDFSKVITPEMMTKISGGGEEATAAMIQAMNSVAQETYASSAQASIKLIETALAKQREQFQAELPNLIKNQNLSENLRTKNPIFNHPAATPMLETLQKQMAIKYPNATATEQQKMAEDFLVSFATTANPAKPTPAQVASSKETDWSDFF